MRHHSSFLQWLRRPSILLAAALGLYLTPCDGLHAQVADSTNNPPSASSTPATPAVPATPSDPAASTTASAPTVPPPHVAPTDPAPTNTPGTEGISNAPPLTLVPLGNTNIFAVPAQTNQPDSSLEGPGEISNPGDVSNPGTMNNPAVEDITNQSGPADTSSTLPGGIPNSPAVQDISHQSMFDRFVEGASPLHLGLNVGETYDDNILISPDKTGSFITHVTPSIDFQKGDQTAPHMNYLNLYFAPTFYLYQDHSQYNRTDLDADLYYQYTFTRLSLGFEQQYQHLTDASLDIGTLVARDVYTSKFTANYLYNDDLTLYGTATQQINDYPELEIKEWDIDTYALYQVAPKLLVGVGPRLAFIDISGATNQSHQDLLFRLKYIPDKKFSIGFDGGVEYLQYQDSTPGRVLPIFDFNITYSPFDRTQLFLSAFRANINSYDLLGDTITYSSVQGGASQQFLRNFKLTLTFGYSSSDYATASRNAAGVIESGPRRDDDYYFAKGLLEWTPNRWLKVQGSYQWSTNRSTFADNTFNDNQVDIQSSVEF